MAIKTLCEAGLCGVALNSGRRLDPGQGTSRNHKQPYDMLYRGFWRSPKRDDYYHIENEYSEGVWEHGITYNDRARHELGMASRCHAVGGKTNFWGRSAAPHGRHRFQDGERRRRDIDVDWPVTYDGDRALLQPRRAR